MSTSGSLLDTRRKIETPEGVELMLRVAGPIPRGGAWLLDTLLRSVVFIGSLFFLPRFGNFGAGLFLLILFGMFWLYHVLFEVYWHGATPGKRAFRIRVVNRNGTPVGWGQSVVRNLIRFLDFLPPFYGFGLASVLLSRDFQRLGDIAAGTVVVHDEAPQKKAVPAKIAPRTPARALSQEEQHAILAFGDRVTQVSSDRAAELAGILDGYLTVPGEPGDQQLTAMAKWLAGRS